MHPVTRSPVLLADRQVLKMGFNSLFTMNITASKGQMF